MSYIQITERCQMKCVHCCMGATAKGRDMTWETFKAAIDQEAGNHVTIGGGEPTLHPQFERFLFYAIGKCESVWLATNGGITDKALVLASLARRGVLGVALSIDPWHDPIDQKVVAAFDKKASHCCDHDMREIRNVSGHVIRAGRAAGRGFANEEPTEEGCPCDTCMVKPDGTVRQCGCPRSPVIGSVAAGWEPMKGRDGDPEEGCYKYLLKSRKTA